MGIGMLALFINLFIFNFIYVSFQWIREFIRFIYLLEFIKRKYAFNILQYVITYTHLILFFIFLINTLLYFTYN
jgi:hypothetical protein